MSCDGRGRLKHKEGGLGLTVLATRRITSLCGLPTPAQGALVIKPHNMHHPPPPLPLPAASPTLVNTSYTHRGGHFYSHKDIWSPVKPISSQNVSVMTGRPCNHSHSYMHRTEVGLTGEARIPFLDDLIYLKRVRGSRGVKERHRQREIKRKSPV